LLSQALNDKVADQIPDMIVAFNMYLQAYHMYSDRTDASNLSRDALDSLQKEFPFGVRRADGTLCLYWRMEKLHSMVHWASN
jgi:hypothetical protein